MRAAFFVGPNQPVDIVDGVDIAEPPPGYVRVRMTHCGICHSDLHVLTGMIPTPVPTIMGHEGAGVIESVGVGVDHLAAGDHVILSPMASCGHCHSCVSGHPTVCDLAVTWPTGLLPDGTSPLSRGGATVYRGNGLGGWADMAIVAAGSAIKVGADVPLDVACLIGCAVQTGMGAVLNTAKVHEGANVLVMGLGGIGLSVVLGAKVAGAAQIIVSDPVPSRRATALAIGATTAIDPAESDVVRTVRAQTGGAGVDFAFDAAGSAALIAAGVRACAHGGATVMIGAPDPHDTLGVINPSSLIVNEKRLLASMVGSSLAPRDFPRIVALWQSGRIDLDRLVTSRRPLQEINAGFDDMRSSTGIRTVIAL